MSNELEGVGSACQRAQSLPTGVPFLGPPCRQEGAPDKFTVDVLCWCVEAPVSDAEVGLPKPCTGNLRGEMKVVVFEAGGPPGGHGFLSIQNTSRI